MIRRYTSFSESYRERNLILEEDKLLAKNIWENRTSLIKADTKQNT